MAWNFRTKKTNRVEVALSNFCVCGRCRGKKGAVAAVIEYAALTGHAGSREDVLLWLADAASNSDGRERLGEAVGDMIVDIAKYAERLGVSGTAVLDSARARVEREATAVARVDDSRWYEIEIGGLIWRIGHFRGGAIGGAHQGVWEYRAHWGRDLIDDGALYCPQLMTHWEAAEMIAGDPDVRERVALAHSRAVACLDSFAGAGRQG